MERGIFKQGADLYSWPNLEAGGFIRLTESTPFEIIDEIGTDGEDDGIVRVKIELPDKEKANGVKDVFYTTRAYAQEHLIQEDDQNDQLE